MITLDQAMTADEFWHVDENDDGRPGLVARRRGKTIMWGPNDRYFLVPVRIVKPKVNGAIRQHDIQSHDESGDARQWCTPERWGVEHVIYGGRYAGQPDVRAGDCAKCGQQPGECVCNA